MGQSKITTPEGFRDALEDFDAKLHLLSADDAADRVNRLLGAAPKAAKATPKEDLDDVLLLVESIKSRVRRKAKRQRSVNLRGGGGGGLIAAGAVWVAKLTTVTVAPWLLPTLLVLGVFVGVVSAWALSDSAEWRDDVGKPIDAVTAVVAKELAEGVERKAPYRSLPAAAVNASESSTGVRVEPTIAVDARDEDPDSSSAVDPQRGRR